MRGQERTKRESTKLNERKGGRRRRKSGENKGLQSRQAVEKGGAAIPTRADVYTFCLQRSRLCAPIECLRIASAAAIKARSSPLKGRELQVTGTNGPLGQARAEPGRTNVFIFCGYEI